MASFTDLPGWFKPTHKFKADGRTWCSNGHIAVAIEPPKGEYNTPPEDSLMREVTRAEKCSPSTFGPVDEKGYRASSVGKFYAAHYIDAPERAWPGIVWRDDAEWSAAAVGFVDGRAVAIVMPVRGEPDETWRAAYPECATCEGDGKTHECDACDGTGDTDDYDECGTCGGDGRVGQCADCGGTGRWQEKATAA